MLQEKQEEEFIEFDELADANFKEEQIINDEQLIIKKKPKKQQEIVIEEEYPITKKIKYMKEEQPQPKKQHPIKIHKVEKNYSLAVYDIKDKFLQNLEQRQVVVVTGETGCGKSTQIPQMLIEDNKQKGQKIKIICTQPRRIAAMSLAQRVANEVGCSLGSTVGYIVGMDSMTSSSTKIEFVTTGIMLQKLVFEREKFFEEYTHIIMDEVHERDLDIDFAFIIIKHFLKDYSNVKLILMSATICCEKFANYFSDYSINNIFNQEVIKKTIEEFMSEERMKIEESQWGQNQQQQEPQVTGWTQPQISQQEIEFIKQRQREEEIKRKNRERGLHFLGDQGKPAPIIQIPDKRIYSISCYYLDTLEEYFGEFNIAVPQIYVSRSQFNFERPTVVDTQKEGFFKILELINKIKRNDKNAGSMAQGSILVFLPGYQEIMDIKEELNDEMYQIVVLHGSISTSSKELASFQGRKRRIILSTNIAESSITVPDCQYVIDFCLSKAIQYNSKTLTERLVMEFSSQSSCQQRMGRVGRVGEGICFRLIPREIYENKFRTYADCEMVRCPLEKILLRIAKTHQLELDQIQLIKQQEKDDNIQTIPIKRQHIFKDWQKVLSTALDPPSISQIGYSVKNLQKVGAIKISETQFDSSYHSITKLGLLMCDLPIDIYLSRFIVIASLLKCPLEGITVAAILSQRKNFFQPAFKRDQINYLNTIYNYDMGDQDEILVQLRVFKQWEDTFFRSFQQQWQDKPNYRKMLKRFTSQPPNRDEYQFSQQTCIDLKTMREILLVKYEIYMRIQDDLQDVKEHDLMNEDFVMLLKTILVGGFYSKCVEVVKQSTKEIDRRINMIKVNNLQQDRCLIFESAQELEEDKVSSLIYQAFKQPIKAIVKQKNIMAVEFVTKCNVIFRRLLHEIDMLSRKNVQKYQPDCHKNSTPLTQYLMKKEALVYHCNQGRMYGVGKEVICDADSINYIQIAEEEAYYLVCYDITEKDGSRRNVARHSSRVDKWQNWVAISIMLFGCNVLVAQEHNRYTKIIENQGSEIALKHFFKEDEILEINDIRERIKNNLLEHDFSHDFWQEIKELNRQRAKMHIFQQDKWQTIFEQDCKDKLNLLKTPKKETKRKIRGLHNHGQFSGIHIDEFKKRFVGEFGGFMEPISTFKINDNNDNQLSYFDDHGIASYTQTLQLYINWKKQLLTSLAKLERQTSMSKTSILICNQCQDYVQIGTSDNLAYFNDSKLNPDTLEWLKGTAQFLSINQFTDHFHFCVRSELVNQFANNDLVSAILKKLNVQTNDLVYFTCPSQNHIIGFFLKSRISDIYSVQKIMVITQKLKVVHLNLEEYSYNMRKYSIEDVVSKDKEQHQKLLPKLDNQQFECKLCINEVNYEEGFQVVGKQQFRKHLISQKHQNNLEEIKMTIKE